MFFFLGHTGAVAIFTGFTLNCDYIKEKGRNGGRKEGETLSA